MSDLKKIKILLWIDIVSTVIAVIALVVSILAFSSKGATIQTSVKDSRIRSREDLCHVIKNLAYALVPPQGHASLRLYFKGSELRSCSVFAHHE